MVDFAPFDARGYRTVDVRRGYGAWAATYDQTVDDAKDIGLLGARREVPWRTSARAVGLGCGTGRTGAGLMGHGVASIDVRLPLGRATRASRARPDEPA